MDAAERRRGFDDAMREHGLEPREPIVGDWLADGLLGGLNEAFAASPAGAQFARQRYNLSGLRRNRDIDALEQAMANDPSHIAIVMLGVEDRYSLGSRRKPKEDDEWRQEYGARVDRAMKVPGSKLGWIVLGVGCAAGSGLLLPRQKKQRRSSWKKKGSLMLKPRGRLGNVTTG